MKTLVFSTQPYDRRFLEIANVPHRHKLEFLEARLSRGTASLADSWDAVCVFVNDRLDAETIQRLAEGGVRAVALRCAGFNNVDLDAARSASMQVVRVPAYSPHAVAEHTVGLMLALNRNLHRAYGRVRDGNFALGGLMGFDLVGRTVGVIGTGQIGEIVGRIMQGFGCRVLGFDPRPNDACQDIGIEYVDLPTLFGESDILSLHCPLTPDTHHLINTESLAQMKRGVMIINTSRGGVVDTRAVVEGLKSGQVGHLGLDVYEEEGDYFFQDLSDHAIPDDTLARLLTFPNVLITGHQAFFTHEAMTSIAETTLANLAEVETTGKCQNAVG
ncbi:D-lactate dehydrogenase [Botrimarina colliarenosi]|uniref:D-lactate dehydrogenase n=1 Tax=Botrimarina colliarenosi TaxID=2528001 RepID=A0A5C6AMQ5_9BACT|nr:2-hydroxyacid dehydrogenase [Botrimarina colliarenosi]TWU00282.1 D-lactate dehydrogenase [Botrimarina colliarenosi]